MRARGERLAALVTQDASTPKALRGVTKWGLVGPEGDMVPEGSDCWIVQRHYAEPSEGGLPRLDILADTYCAYDGGAYDMPHGGLFVPAVPLDSVRLTQVVRRGDPNFPLLEAVFERLAEVTDAD